MLVRTGLMTGEQLLTAQREDQRKGMPFSTYLVEMGFIDEQQLAGFISESYGLPLLEPTALDEVTRDALARLPRELAERHRLLPLRVKGHELQVCLSDPQHLEELEVIEQAIGYTLSACIITETALSDALEEHYGIRPEVRLFREGKAPPPNDRNARRVKQVIDRTGVFQAYTPAASPAPTPEDPVERLADADSSDDVLRAALTFFAQIFVDVATLGINKGKAVVLMVGNRDGLHAPPQRMGITLPDGSLVRAVLDRPHVAHYPTVPDGNLVKLFRKLGLSTVDVTLVPVFAHGRPAFVVIGLGLQELHLKDHFGEIRDFVAKVSDALARVAPPPAGARH